MKHRAADVNNSVEMKREELLMTHHATTNNKKQESKWLVFEMYVCEMQNDWSNEYIAVS